MKIGEYIKEEREKIELSINQLALYSDVSAAHISRIERGLRDPSPEILKKISTPLKIPYEKLMEIAGYLSEKTDEKETQKTSTLTSKDQREIEKILEQTEKALLTQEGLMFDGVPASDETKRKIIDAMRIGMELAKKEAKEKYTPKKHKKNEANENND